MSARYFAGCFACAALLLSVGCAQQPPGTNALSGKRLVVTMRFRSPVNTGDHYFFLINNAADQNAPGPIPVLQPPYGNGFATGAGGSSAFTDFVRFDAAQPQGYGLYHVIGDANRSNFVYEGRPINSTLPDQNDPRTASTLSFELDLSQLETDSNGGQLTSDQAANMARSLRYLQINMISTDVVPRDATTPVIKQVDSLGDTRTSTGATSFLVIDLAQNRVYRNSDYAGQALFEPADDDVFVSGSSAPHDPAIDLIDWSVEVRQQ